MRTPSAPLLRGGGEGVQHLLIDISAIQGEQIFLHQRQTFSRARARSASDTGRTSMPSR